MPSILLPQQTSPKARPVKQPIPALHLALIFGAILLFCAFVSLGAFGLAFAFDEMQQNNSASSAIKKHVIAPKGWTEEAQPRPDMRRFLSPNKDHELLVVVFGGGTPNSSEMSYGQCADMLVEFGTGFVNGFLKVKRPKLKSNQYELLKAQAPFQCQLVLKKNVIDLDVEIGSLPCKNLGFQFVYALEEPNGAGIELERIMKCE